MDEPTTEFAQDRGVEARIGEFQPQHRLPVDPAADGFGRLPVRKVLHELEDRHQGQSPGCRSRLAVGGEEIGELPIGEEGAQFVSELQAQVAVRESGAGDADGFFGNGIGGLGFQAHEIPPSF